MIKLPLELSDTVAKLTPCHTLLFHGNVLTLIINQALNRVNYKNKYQYLGSPKIDGKDSIGFSLWLYFRSFS